MSFIKGFASFRLGTPNSSYCEQFIASIFFKDRVALLLNEAIDGKGVLY
jgi:hypothetical protein